MKVIKFFFLFLIVLSVSLAGCAGGSRTGYVIEIRDNSLLVAQTISLERYNELKDVPSNEWINQEGLGLISVRYEGAEEFEAGDQVKFWLDGGVRESYPEQADAKKVERK